MAIPYTRSIGGAFPSKPIRNHVGQLANMLLSPGPYATLPRTRNLVHTEGVGQTNK